jgi:hypothetical protein
MCEHLDGMGDMSESELEWSIKYTNVEGNEITLTHSDAENLLNTLMHHRLLRVEVEFPETCTEALERASFAMNGASMAATYADDGGVITIDVDSAGLWGYRTRAAANRVAAEDAKKKKKGGSK